MNRKVFLSGLALVLCILPGLVIPTRADIAPPDPPSGSNIMPGQATRVRMVAETVILEVPPAGDIRVDASFTMRNLGQAEERMEVYFPLNFPLNYIYPAWISVQCDSFGREKLNFIDDLSAWVDGIKKPVTTRYIKRAAPKEGDIPCWGTFPVVFPAEKDVQIRVTYTTSQAYYTLVTGAGWEGSIGSADIIVRFPYEVNDLNFFGCFPRWGSVTSGFPACQMVGKEVRWRQEDFEPEYDFSFDYRSPQSWGKVITELEATRHHPQDGEAWGRLGMVYKNLIVGYEPIGKFEYSAEKTMGCGFGMEMEAKIFRLSAKAYQQALALKPDDAGWQYGYAELLCLKTLQSQPMVANGEMDSATYEQEGIACAKQLKLVLENNSANYEKDALHMLERLGGEIADLSGPQPDFVILTPPPATLTPRPTRTFTSTSLPVVTTATRAPSQTALATTAPTTPTPTESAAVAAAETSQPTRTPGKAAPPGLCGAGALPGMLVGLWAWIRQARRR